MTTTVMEAPIRVDALSIARATIDGSQPLVTNVSFEIVRGATLALVGESGSGKSLSALACMGLLPQGVSVTGGDIHLFGMNASALTEREWRRLRGPRVGMVFQDPMTSLDPCFKVGRQLSETILAHEGISHSEARSRALELLDQVRIPRADERYDAYPYELSGGLRQRIMIASALALRPDILIADEPTTALDVTTQAAIVSLVDNLRRDLDIGVLWITHDLGVVAQIADRVVVLYAGEIVECASTRDIFGRPQHPYTVGLIDSARIRPPGVPFGLIKGSVPEPGSWPAGCRFAPRCSISDDTCQAHPNLLSVDDHEVRCFYPGRLK